MIYGQTATFSADLSYGSHTARRTATLPLRGRFPPGEMVLLDEAADPGRYGSSPGAIFRLSPDAGQALRVLFTGPPWVDPSAAEFGPDGTLYIADRRGNDPGRIYRIDTRTGLPVALLPDLPQLVNPIDLAFTPDGNLLIVDRDAVSQFPAAKGLVFRLDGTSEPLTVFAESPEFRSPGQLTFDDQGRLFLTDRAANPDSAAGNVGAIFELDPDDGSVLRHYQFEELPEPTGIDALADGTLLVTDAAANPRGYSGPHGTLFTLDPDAGTLRELLTHQSLIRPYRSHVRQQGTILVVDQSAAGPGQNGSPGTLFEFDPVSRTIRNYAQSDSFRSLSDLAEFPASLVAVSAYGVEDPDGPPLYPADRLTITAQIVNRGAVAAVGASYTDSLPEAARIVAGSITASEGTATVLGNAVYWGGTLAAGAVVDLSYDVQLDPFLAEGQILTFRGTAQGPHSEPRSAAQTVPVFVPLEGGSVYLADSAADPLGIGNQPGAIFKVNQRTGETTVYATYPQSRDPVDLALVGTARPMMYVIDQLFTLGAPARGGLFEIDPTTQESRLVAADSTWFRLEDVLPAGDDAVLVLDGFADPLHLTPTIGPGALYRVGLPEGNVELVYSDTTLTNPRAMTYLPDGRIAIVDADADPLDTGVRSGAVFAFDLSTKEIELIVAYPQWVDPSELTWTGEDLLVVDPSANPDPASQGFGSVWRVPLEGPVELYAVSDYFRRLGAIVSPTDGRPLLSDLDATIGTGTPLGGAVFRWSSRRTSNARFFPLAANRLLLQPQGMILFEDVTPVVYLPFEAAAESEGGIALTWED
ncbi:MAG: hypothetical protein R3E12_06460 [Candidatus Eisenbacteria bacterium]